MSDSGQPEVIIYEDAEQGLTIFGLDDGDGVAAALRGRVADIDADHLARRRPVGVHHRLVNHHGHA